MGYSIFIRSYEKDFEWLSFALRSIYKFASGFNDVVIAVPAGQESKLRHLTVERIILCHDGQPGYLCQQNDKLNADIHTNADFVWSMDSDCVLTRPVRPEMFFRDGKPIWMMTPWSALSGDEFRSWAHIMVKCVQDFPTHEFMRRHGQMIPGWAYREFRAFIERTHKCTMTEYVMSQQGHEFSEFNCLGFYLYKHHRDKFYWWDTEVDGVPEAVMDQHWSWSGMTPELRNKLSVALA